MTDAFVSENKNNGLEGVKLGMVKIAVLGHGVVGSGVVEVLMKNHEGIAHRAKEEIEVKYILDLRDFPDLPYADKFVKDFSVIEKDPEVEIVVECMGGVNPAFDFCMRSLKAGKSVATSNKELVAAKGQELLQAAQDNNLNFLFEASVGGGIPILRPISQCMAANEISAVAGILNGTTNFILTKMITENMAFDDALRLAQNLGYAEKNPTADVDGHDACRKICILASLVSGKHIYPDDVYVEGIRNITLDDVAYAEKFDAAIKLIGLFRKQDNGKIQINVAPRMVSKSFPLAGVNDVFNAICVVGDATDEVMFYGKGAGKMPTASAVVADVIDCVKHRKARKYLYWEPAEKGMVADYHEEVCSMYMRLNGKSSEEIMTVANELCRECIYTDGVNEDEIAIITDVAPYSEQEKIAKTFLARGINVVSAMRTLKM